MKQSNNQCFTFPSACSFEEQSPSSARIDHYSIATDNAFLTINPCYTGHGEISSYNIQIDMQSDEEEELDEGELFFDMDVSCESSYNTMWDSRQLMIHKQAELEGNGGNDDDDDDDEAEGEALKEHGGGQEAAAADDAGYDQYDSNEFEFSMTWSETGSMLIPDCHYPILANNNDDDHHQYMISPADDLFYKGQLLPLHLPPRIKMVEELSSCTITAAAGSINPSINHADHNLCFFDADFTKPVPDPINDKDLKLQFKPGMGLIQHAVIPSVSNYCSSRPAGQPVHGAAGALVQRAACMEADHNTPVTRHLCTRITSSWLDMQDPNVFPRCYQDPSLNSIGGGGAACKSGRTSLKWKIYLPGIWRLRSSSNIDDNHSGPVESTELNASSNEGKIKQGSWAVMSMFNIRASSSVLRTFFFNGSASGQQHKLMMRRGEEEEPPWPSSKSHLNPSLDKEFNVCDTDHGFAAGIASHASNSSSSSSSYTSSSSSSSSSSTSSPSHTKQKSYGMSIGKANQYLSKYAKIFKSVYVYVLSYSKGSSATAVDNDHHHDRHLMHEMEAPPLKSAASLLGLPKNPKSQVSLKATSSSFTFTKRLGNDLISCNNISHVFPPATTNISPLSAPYCSSKRSASTEVDNGIQSAIAHCKRSSEAQSSQYPEDSSHPHSRTTINGFQSSIRDCMSLS